MFFFLIFLRGPSLASVFVCLIVFALYFLFLFLNRSHFWLKGKLLRTYQLPHIINFEFNTALLIFLQLFTCVALGNATHDTIFFVFLQRNNLPAVRQYLETFAINIYLKFPYLVRLSFSALLSCHLFFVSCLYSFAISLVIGIKIGVMPRREILLKVGLSIKGLRIDEYML